MSVLWTAAEAAEATGGEARGNWSVTGVSIDTRSLASGDLFVALKAARDGHDFVPQALEKGAGAALVSRVPDGVAGAALVSRVPDGVAGAALVSRVPDGVAGDAPLLLVEDVQAALEALGRAARARSAARVVAVTGSVGKTSTKEMLRTVLARQGRTHAAEASYNNHWGVPLTLARMPRETEFAVLELGMNAPGEIAPLSRLARPDVALVTTIAPAHLEAFGHIDGIAREKASIFEGLAEDGTAIVNVDLPTSPILLDAARAAGARIVTFGTTAEDFRLETAEIAGDSTVVQARIAGEVARFKLASAGRHFAMNGLATLAAVEALGGDPGRAAPDLGLWEPPAGRGTREEVVLDPARRGWTLELIDDAFNANPASLEAALEVLAAATPRDGVGRIAHGRRIAILGDMLELGEDEIALHRGAAGMAPIGGLDTVHCVGPRMYHLWEALSRDKRGTWADTAEEMVAELPDLVDAGDVVLVKGSKVSRVSLVAEALRNTGRRSRPRSEDD
ncbi:UDP-N-acetylmuramoyl-tripeptide--D-alanyl-D-alanine ligase [Roseovarius sp. SCSIO 43702]|uniref:UDP-N-acetylmuramoyl-tripeptide--D-alanyl-D- alanine ligase n=1 Tax=Roseovarius sp. SCSIO 43702 TaxID=2823043 RepID=UPI001C72E218|nr:UDP-N-acetylmuramoyl-tripeptide--D-alanyl-D-alanine ligase [Roseovarius sp. SCSIO 43702]QYX58204.1 UDP-N-acetylmuramoyl-tripeptide--D-alanyl-D-alanine ligase [Roseovarius sp. SCSIO 43702]